MVIVKVGVVLHPDNKILTVIPDKLRFEIVYK